MKNLQENYNKLKDNNNPNKMLLPKQSHLKITMIILLTKNKLIEKIN